MNTYAIGDVHGQLDYLKRVLAWVELDAGDAGATVVFVGDYIDRGPDSAGVVELLMAGPTNPKHRWVCLKGNHEDMLLAARTSDEAVRMWAANGGHETLDSYQKLQVVDAPVGQIIPESHFAWMEKLPLIFQDDFRVFAHAALDPEKPLQEQTSAFVLWGRLEEREYLNCTAAKLSDGVGRLFVHGHTPHLRGGPKFIPNAALNLDTGSCFGGSLSCAAWRPGDTYPRVFQANQYQDRVRYWEPNPGSWSSKSTPTQRAINERLGIPE